jgi:ribosome-binding protein aMBF1 (putative translation factor)
MAKKANTPEQFRKALGKQIKKRREDKELSTYGMAKLIDKPQPRIPEIEQGKIKDIDTYMKCLSVLGGNLEVKWLDLNQ